MAAASGPGAIGVSGTGFTLDGAPFPFTGISFFNAIYNIPFNISEGDRKDWLSRFEACGINVLRIWGQWDNLRGWAGTAPEHTLYRSDGSLNAGPLAVLRDIADTACSRNMVIELALFSQESWYDGVRLSPDAGDRAVAELTREMQGHRNVVFQIWNELSERAAEHVDTIKSIDANRLVTNASGMGGVLMAPPGFGDLERKLDYLTPHTSRQDNCDGPHWETAPLEISYLLSRFRKPVVDDEPARNGTRDHGGPIDETTPYDHILQIYDVWRAGGHVIYHHDMFQTPGTDAVPPSEIPEPNHNPYHRQVLEFIALRDRFCPMYRDAS